MPNLCRLLPFLAALAVAAPTTACHKPAETTSEGETKIYSTRGTLKSFGPDKKYASIAHEDIPGYMSAMTMSFTPQNPAQFDGLNPGDKVEFSFKPEGGKHILTAIKKIP
ncbi:MAG: copper-binding protein [Myxococcales bacterium]|nr:copper-binding protein [Polyangiaceae bacterium]MDW8251219.1 copper-binding protein [Myxococcales bacterium]